MDPRLYIKKTVNSLSKIILKIQGRNSINYHTVRMSDLCDELYKGDTLVGNEHLQGEIEFNGQVELKNERNELRHGKKRIVITIKICDVPDETKSLLINMSIRTDGSIGYNFDSNKFMKQFESEISDRTFIIELTECGNILPAVDYNVNFQIKDKERDENNAKAVRSNEENVIVPKQDNSNGMIDIKLTIHIVHDSYKPEYKETCFNRDEMYIENLYVPPKEVNGKSCAGVHDITTFTSEQDKYIYFHSDKNEGTVKVNIENQSEFKTSECIYICDSEIFNSNTYEEETINNISNTRQDEDQENMSDKCYVIEINIPKEGNSEDEQVVKSIQDLPNLENNNKISQFIIEDMMTEVNETDRNGADSKENKSTEEKYENNVSTDISQENICNNKNKKIIEDCLSDTNEAIETSHNNENTKKNSFRAQQNKSTNNSFQCLQEEQKIRDSLIIKDLVMTKYGETLKQFMQRSLRRKQTRKRQSLCDNERTDLKQKFNRPMSLDFQCNKDVSHLLYKSKTPDSGLGATQDLDFSNCRSNESFQNSNQSFRYSSMIFLKQALGDEYMNVTFNSEQENLEKRLGTPLPESYKSSHGVSIGSSEISTLISTTMDSLYSTVDKTRKKRPSELKKTSEAHPNSTALDNYIYESIENFKINLKAEELNTAISVQSAIITQISKALSLCRESPVFFGSIPHLEAEKYLLFSTYKKLILETQLNRDYEDIGSEQCYGTVNVENLRFSLYTGHAMEIKKTDEYYMCLLHSDTTLLASNIVLPERNGQIIFKQSFQFNNLMSDFQIYVKIFSMVLEKHYKKRQCLSPTKFRSSWRNGKTCNKRTDGLPELSSFRLIGTSKIAVTDLYTSNALYIEKVSSKGKICDSFMADIHSSIKISNNIRGFLTIGSTNVLWNRRWCVLEGPFLKYWNYPSDENDREPIGVFDLSDSVTHQITNVNKILCSRPRTFMLQIELEGEVVHYFLQADNLVEFEEWKRQLNSVLISLNNWKCLKN